MSIHVALNHVTHYRYDRPINLGPQIVRLRPAPHSRTRILSYSMRVEPATHFINWQQDPQSNYLARLVFPDKTTSFRIEIDLVAEMAVLNPFDFFLEPSAEHYPFKYAPELATEARRVCAALGRTRPEDIAFAIQVIQLGHASGQAPRPTAAPAGTSTPPRAPSVNETRRRLREVGAHKARRLGRILQGMIGGERRDRVFPSLNGKVARRIGCKVEAMTVEQLAQRDALLAQWTAHAEEVAAEGRGGEWVEAWLND